MHRLLLWMFCLLSFVSLSASAQSQQNNAALHSPHTSSKNVLVPSTLTAAQTKAPPCIIVIFGATGDLTSRKLLPALYHLAKEKYLSENSVIVGFARKNLSHQTFRNQMNEALDQFAKSSPKDDSFWNGFENKIFYHQGEFDEGEGYDSLQNFLSQLDAEFGTQGNRLYYLATPPSYFPDIIEQLSSHQLIYEEADVERWSRVLIEKPFGTDLESAIELQKHISENLHESQVFRVDHYLGKEGVQNLIALRFENRIFEPIWNNQYIDSIQVTLSEEIGIGSRGQFWEETGALRDLFQNHLMQLLALVAMEPPREFKAGNIYEEKIRVLNAIRPFPQQDIDSYVIRGQYGPGIVNGSNVVGYRQEQAVSPASNVETYVAAKIFIDNERWKGVPFYLRCGKRLDKQIAEVVIVFKADVGHAANVLFIRIQPNAGVFLKTLAKVPSLLTDELKPIIFGYTLDSSFGIPAPDAYEKLLYDCIRGDHRLFVVAEEQLAAWRLLTPVLRFWQQHPEKSFSNYDAGTSGPEAADRLFDHHLWETTAK